MDKANREARLRMSGLDEANIGRLAAIWPVLEPRLDVILERFYRHVKSEPRLAAMIGTHQPQLVSAQKAHWNRLMTSGFDADYFESTVRIGNVHYKIGLEPGAYIAGYQFALNEMIAALRDHFGLRTKALTEALGALNRAVFLDLDLAISTYQTALETAIRSRAETVEQASLDFRTGFTATIGHFAAGAQRLSETSGRLTTISSRAQQSASSLSEFAVKATQDSASVAAAAEEMTKSITEIASRVHVASEGIRETTGLAQKSAAEVARLNEAVGSIGEIVALIQGIAAQTNLLALNATIEAARAGEAGRGFAVVATEVKTLASQTARATTEISARIQDVRASTDRAISSIDDIVGAISNVEDAATGIAAAMEEQTAATNEIAARIQGVSDGTAQVGAYVEALNDAVEESSRATSGVTEAFNVVQEQSLGLKSSVDGFMLRLKDADSVEKAA